MRIEAFERAKVEMTVKVYCRVKSGPVQGREKMENLLTFWDKNLFFFSHTESYSKVEK